MSDDSTSYVHLEEDEKDEEDDIELSLSTKLNDLADSADCVASDEEDADCEAPAKRCAVCLWKRAAIVIVILYLVCSLGMNTWVNLSNRRVIVLFGDSLIHRPCSAHALGYSLNDDLYSRTNNVFPEIVCAGTSGAPIAELRGKMYSDVLARSDYSSPFTFQRSGPPRAVVLYWDSDINSGHAPANPSSNTSVAAYLDNLYYVIERLQSNGVLVVLAGPSLSGELPDGENELDVHLNYYVQLNNETAVKYNITYINTRALHYEELPDGWDHVSGHLTEDGEHPNGRGAALLRRAFRDALLETDIF